MNNEEDILKAWDDHFSKLSPEEIEKDVEIINGIGTVGVSYEEYLHILNTVTSYSLVETGLCDDIAFADFFNNSIECVTMGDLVSYEILPIVRVLASQTITNESIDVIAGESNYAMAA